MAVLQKIRVKFGLAISIIIALALLSFIIDPTMLESALQTMSSKYDVGEINGKAISYTAFQEDIDYQTAINEITTGSSVQNEQAQQQIRNNAWQALIDKYLFVKNAKAAGITVGPAEMTNLLSGDMVSPMIAQNYAFFDENGQFSASALSQFVQNLDQDETGRLRMYWNYLQNTIRTQQYYAKYGSLFTMSNVTNPVMLRRAIAENNTTATVDYVMVPFGYAQDSTINVSGSEIKKYYNGHKDFFRQQASRDIEYVVYEVVPSTEDISAANEKMISLYDEFKAAENVKNFLMKNSDRKLDEYWYKKGELNTVSAQVEEFVAGAKKGEISPILADGNTFYAVKVLGEEKLADSIYVKHILLQGENADHVADSLLNVLKRSGKASFSNLASLYSADSNSAADGEMGNIGWMTQTYIIPGFEGAFFFKNGEPQIVKTQYGTHIVVVDKKSAPVAKKQVAILEKETIASNITFNDYYSRANKFATMANDGYDAFRDAADSLGLYAHPMNHVLESNAAYGAIDGAREVTRWIYDNKAGKVSGIISVDNKYFFVVVLKAIHEEGYTPVKEVAPQIRQVLYAEKYGKKMADDAAAKIEGLTDLNAIAEALGSTVTTESIAFSSMASQPVDPALIGAAFAAKDGAIYGPVAGNMGVFVLQVKGTEEGSFYTEDDAKNRAAQESQYNAQMILPLMMQEGEVKDNRARFY